MSTLEFDSTLYPISAVRKAALDYAAIAKINVEKTAIGCRCRVETSQAPIEITMLEFANYVLALSCIKESAYDGD